MSSQTEIANMALANLGQSPITDINESSAPAIACKTFFENARKATLRAAGWNFAGARAQLTADATAPLFGYRFQYPLPADYMRLIMVNGRYSGTKLTCHKIEGQMLLSNESPVQIVYVRDVPLTGTWPEDFVLAFSYQLAALVAPRLMTDGGSSAVVMVKQKFEAMMVALNADMTESKPEVVNALQGSAYQAARCSPAPGEGWGWWWRLPGIPLEWEVSPNPYNVLPP